MKERFYYFDGYHGGQEGHMPLGAFRTMLDFIDENPKWRVILDIEPESWKLLRYRDPDTFYRLRKKLKEKDPKIEIVNEMYSQPLSLALSGEGVIRNIVYGRETLRSNLGDIEVENLFTQEPTLTSCLPQILISLGYRHACLFNSTIFAGYSKGLNATVVKWKGNDGSEIIAIPSYDVNKIVRYQNNGSDWWANSNLFAPPKYVEDCEKSGISYPATMGLQDLGYNAEFLPEAWHDGFDRSYLKYVIPKEYFKMVEGMEAPEYSGQEIFRVSLPWSEKALSTYLKAMKSFEYDILNAEMLNFFSSLALGINREEAIRDCWKRYMLMTHHDVFVCTNHEFTKPLRLQLYALRNNFRDLRSDLKFTLTDDDNEDLCLTVFNPLPKKMRRLVRIDLAMDNTISSVKVYCEGKEVSADLFEYEIHSEVSDNLDSDTYMQNDCHKQVFFYGDFKPFEFKEFKLVPSKEKSSSAASLAIHKDDTYIFENSFARIVVDLKRGGAITSWLEKKKNHEYVAGGGTFNEYKGFFDAENRFVSSLEGHADVVSFRGGDNAAELNIRTTVASARLFIRYTFYKDSPYLDVKTGISCASGTKIGDPYKTKDSNDGHRTFYDIKYGFNAYFETSFSQKYLDKHCAFDVCRTEDADTSYDNVPDIKHNIAVDWLDVTDGKHGLALLLGRTTSYTKEDDKKTGVSLLWGTDCPCIWSSDLSNVNRVEHYRIIPHEGTWEDADIFLENDEYNRKLCTLIGKPKADYVMPFALLTEKVEASAVFTENGGHFVRLFNYGKGQDVKIELGEEFLGLVPCSHDKRELGPLMKKDSSGTIEVSMRHFEICTFKIVRK